MEDGVAGGFTLLEMIKSGWPVLSVLLVMSIVSLTMITDRYLVFSRSKMDADNFVMAIIAMLNERGVNSAIEHCDKHGKKPIAFVVGRILRQAGGREAKERASRHALQAKIRELEWGLPVLGTIASTAPFIGLFGTVIGIIKAFQTIAVNVGGGPEVVSAGIAEALISTAFGLLVAIPALIGYNHFIHAVHRIVQEVDLAVFEVIEKVSGRQP